MVALAWSTAARRPRMYPTQSIGRSPPAEHFSFAAPGLRGRCAGVDCAVWGGPLVVLLVWCLGRVSAADVTDHQDMVSDFSLSQERSENDSQFFSPEQSS